MTIEEKIHIAYHKLNKIPLRDISNTDINGWINLIYMGEKLDIHVDRTPYARCLGRELKNKLDKFLDNFYEESEPIYSEEHLFAIEGGMNICLKALKNFTSTYISDEVSPASWGVNNAEKVYFYKELEILKEQKENYYYDAEENEEDYEY